MKNNKTIQQVCIDAIRILSIDAVQAANSGHPGMPMGAAPMAFELWTKFLRFNPDEPGWINRDRFILSAGHGSMLLYSLLYLTGYDISLDDLKKFRQLDSKTPGHPEYRHTPGVETTTGPLGQGFANGVGMAIAQKYLSARYNKPGFDIFDYRIFAICSDGDLMEGISSEAASLAGHLKLGNMIYLYDDNHISIEGNTEIAFTENVKLRFEAFGWQVIEVKDGNDVDAISEAIKSGIDEKEKPTLIKVRTYIAYGSPNKVNTAGAHGSPLGADEVKLTKENLGCDKEKTFYVPEEAINYFKASVEKGKNYFKNWTNLFEKYGRKFSELYDELRNSISGKPVRDIENMLPLFQDKDGAVATRTASGKVLNSLAPFFPDLIGGSADLEPSTDTFLKGFGSFQAGNYAGRNFHFGVREHSMAGVLNGINLTKPLRAFGSTFLIFSDYMKPSIRLAAIMGINPVYVFTHDSIALGEDGTTHQPIEQLISLRSIPNMTVIRPADANETAQAWKCALETFHGPVALILTRQKLPVIDRSKFASARNLLKGAYILSDSKKFPELIIIASGSEVYIALEAQNILDKENIAARVVSMPSWELFEMQSEEYKEEVLPSKVRKRISVEAGSVIGWMKYVTEEGISIGIDKFGKSAPGNELMKEFGFTADNIVSKAKLLFK